MKTAFLMPVLFLAAAAALQAGFKDSLAMGNMAYRNNDLKEALKYYSAAYAEKPYPQLLERINYIKQQVGEIEANLGPVPDSPWKWVLIGSDIVFAGGSVFFMIWNMNSESLAGQAETFIRFGAGAAVYSITGLLILYTLIDLTSLHWVFPRQTALIPVNNGLMLSYSSPF